MRGLAGQRKLCGIAALALVLGVGTFRPASADVHVSVDIPWPYPYPYPYVYPYPYAYPVLYPYPVYPASPPPGWVPGHWERRYDAAGRPINVWIPPHLR